MALQDIDLQIYPGEFVTITGPSGCGKSTLALCLAGFIPYAYPGRMEGTVRIQGKNTRDYPAGVFLVLWVWCSRIPKPSSVHLP